MKGNEEHSWFHGRIAAHLAGILDEAENTRFRDHIATCSKCREALDAYAEDHSPSGPSGSHIPSSVIARWDKASQALRGLERKLVREHVEWCADCQQDLKILGFEPSLEYDPALEPASEVAKDLTQREGNTDDAPYTIRLLQYEKPFHRWGWLRWPVVGWATVATVAALMLFFGILRPTSQRHIFDDPTVPWVQPRLVRGSERVGTTEIPRGTTMIVLPVAVPVELSPTSQTSVDVLSPDGDLMLRSGVDMHDAQRGVVMLLLSSPDPLKPGTYRVLFWEGNPKLSSSQSTESRFTLNIVDS